MLWRPASDWIGIRVVTQTVKYAFAVLAVALFLILCLLLAPVAGDAQGEPDVQPVRPVVPTCRPTSPKNFNSAVRRLDRAQSYRNWYVGKSHKRTVRYRSSPTVCDLKHLRVKVRRERSRWRRVKVTIPPLLARIAKCENGTGSYTRVNYAFPSPSTAAGRYMMIDSTFWNWARMAGISNPHRWRYAHYAPPRIQDLAAVAGFRSTGGDGSPDWNPSRSCWG